jgi:RNA binding activity-knot of a chromodomain
MASYKEVFDRGYLPNWSDEILTVNQAKKGNPDTYKVKDERGEDFVGSFYAEDLGRVRKDEETTYRIKILKKRTKNGKKEFYVKFIGYNEPPRWIPESDIV